MQQAFSFQLQTAEPILNLKSLVPGLELQKTLYSFNSTCTGETLEVTQERIDPASPQICCMFSSIACRAKSLAISAGLSRLKPLESLFTTSVSDVASGGTILLANETKLGVPFPIFSRVRKSSKLQRLLGSNLMIAPNDTTEELVIFVVESILSRKMVYSLVPLVYLRRKAQAIVVFQSRKLPVESSMRQFEISRWRSLPMSLRLKAISIKGGVGLIVMTYGDAECRKRRVRRRVLTILFIMIVQLKQASGDLQYNKGSLGSNYQKQVFFN